MSPPTKLSPGPWKYEPLTRSVFDADGKNLCGFFSETDDGEWVAWVRQGFSELMSDAQKLITVNKEQEKRLAAKDAQIKSLKEDLAQARWWIERYIEWRSK